MVIYQNGNEYTSTFGLIEEQSKIFGVNITFAEIQYVGSDFSKTIDMIKDYKQKYIQISIVLFIKYELLEDLYPKISTLGINYEDILSVDVDDTELYDLVKANKNQFSNLLFASYSYAIYGNSYGDELRLYIYILIYIYIFIRITGYHLYVETYKISKEQSFHDLLFLFYNTFISDDTGGIYYYVSESNTIEMNVYIYMVVPGRPPFGSASVKKYSGRKIYKYNSNKASNEKYDYYFDSFQYYGRIERTTCSFIKESLHLRKIYGIALVHSLTGKYKKGEYDIMEMEIQALRDISNNV